MDQTLTLDVQLLGGFAARVNGQLIPASVWRQRRAAAIVKLLALEPGHRLHREQLLETLWPDLDPESAANNLRVALHHARRGLEQAGAPPGTFLTRDGDALLLGPREAIQVDVEVFGQAVGRAWQSAEPGLAESAAGLYRGDLLPEDPYEDWAAARREALRASYLTLLARLSGLHEARGDLPRAVAARERVLAADPLDEPTHAALMRLHARMGERDLALAHYARFAALLDRELGAEPERETRELAAAIREGRLSPAPSPPAPAPPRTRRAISPAKLPAAVDLLVGRERELAELERLLGAARLVTLTGPGGIGKTRLGLETARAVVDRFPDGAAFADCSPLRDASLVLPTIARALGAEESGGQATGELLATAIGERRLLLVLDNLEQVATSGVGIAALLASCPNLTVLATSRVRLRLRGEQEYPVSPLSLPALEASGTLAPFSDLEGSPAIELFARRARAARPSFRLTAGNVAAVVAVCRGLDGLPLAIELAAARVRVLAPDQLLRRMARPLDVLGMTASDLPARQRTLRDTIAWSYDLLTPREQILFRRLSVFAGGCTLEGAEAVATLDGEPGFDVVETVAGLIDQSLIFTRPVADEAESRYAMLETIREFAAERLQASGEAESVQSAFEAFLTSLVETAEAGLRGPEQLHWLDRLEEDHDNIRAALGSAFARGDSSFPLDLSPRLWEFWRIRGYPVEGHAWLERTLALADQTTIAPAQRASTEYALGKLSIDLGDYEAANRHFQVSADLWRGLGDRAALADAKNALTIVKLNTGEFDEAQSLGEEALAISRELGEARSAATALLNLGMLAREAGHLRRAIDLLDASLTEWRQLGDPKWIALTTGALGVTHRRAGNPAQARTFLGESDEIYRRQDNFFGLAVNANEYGLLEQDAGQPKQAIELHAAALQHFEAVGAPLGIIESIEWIAVASASAGRALPALHLFGAADTARRALSLPPMDAEATLVDAGLASARLEAGSEAEEALTSGAALTLEMARDIALEIASSEIFS